MNENPSQTEIDLAVERMLTHNYREQIASRTAKIMRERYPDTCPECVDLANELWKAAGALEKAEAAGDYYRRWAHGVTATFIAALLGVCLGILYASSFFTAAGSFLRSVATLLEGGAK